MVDDGANDPIDHMKKNVGTADESKIKNQNLVKAVTEIREKLDKFLLDMQQGKTPTQSDNKTTTSKFKPIDTSKGDQAISPQKEQELMQL